MSQSLRVLFVVNSLGAGGTEHSTAVLLPTLRELGVECRVVTLTVAQEGDESDVRGQGFDVDVLQSSGFIGRVRELRRIIADYRPDVVHTALFDADQIGRLATFGRPAQVVSSLVSTPYAPARFADPAIRRWRLRAVQALDAATGRCFVDRFHAVSEGVALANARALRISPSRITVVPRGRSRDDLGYASAERTERVRRRLAIASNAKVVLSVGRHEYAKAHDDLVRAIARIGDDLPELVVLIAGRTGRTTDSITALIDELHVTDRVRVLGHRTDVADLMSAADVLVISSRFEGTAGVALEAMALDLPIVCTRVAGIEGILADGDTAVLVDVAQPDAMAQAIVSLLNDPARADLMRQRGRMEFDTRFTLESSARHMRDLYESCLSNP